jgi:RimJ/RimL family protein N-acetyltransferase
MLIMNIPTFQSLETPRLVLRRFNEEDMPAFLAYRNDPEVARYQCWHSITESQAKDFINKQKSIQPGMPAEWFQFAIELKVSGVLIGDCGVKVNQEEPRQAEFGITLSLPYQGKGLAYEAVTCMLDYAFNILGLHRVIAIIDCLNQSSVMLLERLGMHREGHFIQNIWFKGAWGDEYLYAILQQEWLQKKRSPIMDKGYNHT